jgi:hypothetical protein
MNDTPILTPSPELESIAAEVLLRSLDQSQTPLTARQLRERLTGPYKLPLAEIEKLLEAQVGEHRVFRYPGTSARYWTQGIEKFARETILKVLATRSLSISELLRRLRSSLKGMEEGAQRRLIGQMVKEGALHEWPPVLGGRTANYSVLPPDPIFYLEDALKKLARKLNVTRESLAEPLQRLATNGETGKERDAKLLARMVQVRLAAAQGAPLPLRELWHSFKSEGWEKSTFDQTVLDLAASYHVTLLKHDFPGMLSAADRAELVVDPFGNHYVGIARR